MSITLEKVGRRLYFRGTPFALKDILKQEGCRWDPAEKSWWIGTTKSQKADDLLSELLDEAQEIKASAPPSKGLHGTTPVVGKARYKGRVYLLLWEGTTRHGPAVKLAFTNGDKTFWVDRDRVEIVKRYPEHTTFWDYQTWKEAARVNEASYGSARGYTQKSFNEQSRCNCHCHNERNAGQPGSILFDGCDRCGCEMC